MRQKPAKGNRDAISFWADPVGLSMATVFPLLLRFEQTGKLTPFVNGGTSFLLEDPCQRFPFRWIDRFVVVEIRVMFTVMVAMALDAITAGLSGVDRG